MKTTLTLAAALATLPALAHAGSPDHLSFVVCQLGGPELELHEQTVIRDFYRYVGKKLGMAEGSIDGTYHTKRAGCLAALAKAPEVLMLSLDMFLEQRKALSLEAIAQVDLEGGTSSRFYLLTTTDGPSSLTELRGKPISGTNLHNPAFVARVIFGGKLGMPAELTLKPEKLGLRAVRSVIRGKATAVLLDESQYKAIRGTPFESKLRLVFTSEPLPNAPVAVAKTRVAEGLSKRLGDVMMQMNSDKNGQELVKTFGIKGFVKPAPGTWKTLEAVMTAGQ